MKLKKKCICNVCEKEFEPDMIDEEIAKDEAGEPVTQFYFVCPHCGHRFNSYIEDSTYRMMLKEYRRLMSIPKKLARQGKNIAQIQAAINKADNYQTKVMQPYYESLKATYGNYGVATDEDINN